MSHFDPKEATLGEVEAWNAAVDAVLNLAVEKVNSYDERDGYERFRRMQELVPLVRALKR